MQYGRIIKEARQKRGLSQKALAEAIGVTPRAIIYWENDQRKISLECADKLFKALYMSIQIGEERGQRIRILLTFPFSEDQ